MESTIKHFGIHGMRWGITRERGRDGRVTNKIVPSEEHKKSRALKSKALIGLSNAEIKELNERLQLEKQYKDLTKKEINKGKGVVKDTLTTIGKTAVTTLGTAATIYIGKKAIEKKFGPTVAAEMFPKKK